MKEEVFFSKTMQDLKRDYKDLYDVNVDLNEVVYNGKALDYKTQKLIALGITAALSDKRATEKQIISNMKEMNATKDEIVDVLRVVFLIAGKPAFIKAMGILYKLTK